VWVLAFHYEHHFLAIWPETGDGPFDVIVRHGYLGVDLFFVLSGFVISMSYAAILASNERRPLLTFIRNRVTRIYPLLMLTTLIAIAIWGLGRQLGRTEWGGPQIEATGILPNIVGIQQWVAVPSINSPSWSVSAELMRLLARAHAKDQSAQPHRSLELRAISDSSSIAMFAHSSKNRCGAGWICRSPNDNRGAGRCAPPVRSPAAPLFRVAHSSATTTSL
jgi:hypothetical protein